MTLEKGSIADSAQMRKRRVDDTRSRRGVNDGV